MSDYIKKSELIKSLTKYKFGAISNDKEREYTKEMVLVIANGLPTLDEKEIIRKPMERIIERLEEKKRSDGTESDREWGKYIGYVDSIKIVKEVGGLNDSTENESKY